MSTNIDNNGLLDIAALERLANQFFKSTEDKPTAEFATYANNQYPVTDTTDIPFATSDAVNLASIPSAGGFGISPSSGYTDSSVDLKDVVTVEHLNYNEGPNIPASLGGSGISPSFIQNRKDINLANPQTSFPDENLQGSKDDILSPANVLKEYFPFEGEQSYLVKPVLVVNDIDLNNVTSQIPATTQIETIDYYFLPVKEKKEVVKDTNPAPSSFPWKFDANLVKKDFPILNERVNGKPIIWLDNAATTQKPQQVIDRISYFYKHENSNIHRAAHELAARATDAYEEARKKVQVFLNAASLNEIVFVRGTTEAINLVAKSWGEQYLQAGDEIIVSHLEHHANIVPWQQLATKKGVKIRVIPVDDDGQILLDEYTKLLNPKTKLVAFTQVSNALGTVTPAKKIIELAHGVGAKVLLDGAQSVSHLRADVQDLNADWFVFSGHKIFGPTGIGVLYGKEELLNQTQPWQGGGNMIKDVTFEHTQFHNAPSRFEAGTGNIADAVGLGAAIDYVTRLGIENIQQYEHYLLLYAIERLKRVPGLKLIGTAKEKTSVLSFVLDKYTNDEVGQALNQEGIAVRTGHHCAQPILRRFGLESTVRPSLAFYNTCEDVNALVEVLHRLAAARK